MVQVNTIQYTNKYNLTLTSLYIYISKHKNEDVVTIIFKKNHMDD